MNQRLLLIFLFIFVPFASAFTITDFSPSLYNPNDTPAMDAALGITGYTIEDFEDTTLVDNLAIEYSTSPGALQTSIPQVHLTPFNTEWDGSHILSNDINNNYGPPTANIVTFHFSQGVDSVGIGVGEFDRLNHSLLVNGVVVALFNQTDMPGFEQVINSGPGGFARNVYVRIDAEQGETIDSIAIDISNSTERVQFDHLAFTGNAVPEPSSLSLFALTIFLSGLVRFCVR